MLELLTLNVDADLVASGPRAVEVLEAGGLVLLPELGFEVAPEELRLLDAGVLEGRSKNVSLSVDGSLGGSALQGPARGAMAAMIARYAAFADDLLAQIAPRYAPALARRRTSYRPGAVATRALSRRKDDRRLHIDAFPASPVGGRRILRVFSNVDPSGAVRQWRLGENSFEQVAAAFAPRLRVKSATVRRLMAAAGITRGVRSAYDQAMLELHDAMKLDDAWQDAAPFRSVAFAPGSSWIVYTDAVLHAAMSGQHALEQTYLMAPAAMRKPEAAPVRVLERITGRRLV